MKNLFAVLAIWLSLVGQHAMANDIPGESSTAPAFTLPAQDGKNVSLSDFSGKWVVLYFYPKDFTSGCSLEAHNFETDSKKYHARHAVILGVSVDSVDSHKSFCTKQGLDFKLLSDTKHGVSDVYGVTTKHGDATIAARTTFLIDPNGIIQKVYTSVKPANHSHDVLSDLDLLQSKQK